LWFVVTSWLAFLHSFCWLAPYTDEILDVDTSKVKMSLKYISKEHKSARIGLCEFDMALSVRNP
jgi:hypothetical protein